mmetsp:Transcript_162715/g.516988  ORF Transcript_162715/g.516988 Transcript_162715/m.516988 type:complete len:275 (+) Transcript_162715:98-922(+)
MEAPSAVDAGQARAFPSPVKHSAAENNRSVSTRAPSESCTLASAPSQFVERRSTNSDSEEDESDGLSNFEPEADELLEDYGHGETMSETQSSETCDSPNIKGFLEQSRSQCVSPVFSDGDGDGRGGFMTCQGGEPILNSDKDDTTHGHVSTPFKNLLEGDENEAFGTCEPMLKLRTASFDTLDSVLGGGVAAVVQYLKADDDILIPTPPPQPPVADKARFNRFHLRVVKTPENQFGDVASRPDTPSTVDSPEANGMAGAAGIALLRWRRAGRTP